MRVCLRTHVHCIICTINQKRTVVPTSLRPSLRLPASRMRKNASHAQPASTWWKRAGGGGRRREAVAVTASTCSGLPSPARSRVSAALSRIQRRLRPIAPLPLTLTPRHPFRPRRSHFRISDEFHLHFSIGYSSYARFAELSDSLSVFLMGWGNISFSECLELSILEYKN